VILIVPTAWERINEALPRRKQSLREAKFTSRAAREAEPRGLRSQAEPGNESTEWRSRDGVSEEQLALVLQWNELPLRPIRAQARPARFPILDPPPWLETGPIGEPFYFGERVQHLCQDIVNRCDELRHVDVSRILFGVTQARNGHSHGLQARVTPLRFRNGSLTRQRRGVLYQVQRYCVAGWEMLYLVTFCLPRFLDQDFDEKLITLFHELYHISPQFDGDLRRHQGRYNIHSHSQKSYDVHMAHLARAYLAGGADPALHAFLRLDFAHLVQRHGSVLGVVVPRPKLIPVAQGMRPKCSLATPDPSASPASPATFGSLP
jgi:hypothetical protein